MRRPARKGFGKYRFVAADRCVAPQNVERPRLVGLPAVQLRISLGFCARSSLQRSHSLAVGRRMSI